MQLPPALLLDLDDTIIAFDTTADESWRTVCADFAAEAGLPAEALFTAIARSREWFWSDLQRHRIGRADPRAARRQVVQRALTQLERPSPDLTRQIADAYSDQRMRLVAPFPGALETLDELRRRGTQLALITNGAASSQREKIERFGLARRFDSILIEGELGIGKPEAAVFHHALQLLDRTTKEAWMVGDSLPFDIAPAANLGLYTVWLKHAYASIPSNSGGKPDRIITSLRELL